MTISTQHDEVLTPKGMERVFLLPGELCVTQEPAFLATLLGSCVSVCIYNKNTGAAAMNHFLRDRIRPEESAQGKFGDSSTTYIIKTLFSKDANPIHYEAKIFGGGAVVGHLGIGSGIGVDNIAVAKEVLNEFAIPIVQSDVGGKHGRKIFFNTKTQDVAVRNIGAHRKDFSEKRMRVLIVDDSPIARQILRDFLETAPEFEVVGEAGDAFEARDMILELDPDVISLDIIMPRLDGLDFLEKLMKYKPMPVVMVSTIAKKNSPIERKAKSLGAVASVDKEMLYSPESRRSVAQIYITALKTAAMTIL